mgnify:FL=1
MSILMSESLLSRVSEQEPTSEKLLANFVITEIDRSAPVTRIEWDCGQISVIGLGIEDLKMLTTIFQYQDVIDLGIPAIDVYCQNILAGSYKLLEHNNYSYELLLEMENDDG